MAQHRFLHEDDFAAGISAGLAPEAEDPMRSAHSRRATVDRSSTRRPVSQWVAEMVGTALALATIVVVGLAVPHGFDLRRTYLDNIRTMSRLRAVLDGQYSGGHAAKQAVINRLAAENPVLLHRMEYSEALVVIGPLMLLAIGLALPSFSIAWAAVGVSSVWLSLNSKVYEGPTLIELTPSHGVTMSDMISFLVLIGALATILRIPCRAVLSKFLGGCVLVATTCGGLLVAVIWA